MQPISAASASAMASRSTGCRVSVITYCCVGLLQRGRLCPCYALFAITARRDNKARRESGLDRLDSVCVRGDDLVKGGAKRRRLRRSQTLDKINTTNNQRPSDQGRHAISVRIMNLLSDDFVL